MAHRSFWGRIFGLLQKGESVYPVEAARRLRKCRGWYFPEMKKIVYAAIAAAPAAAVGGGAKLVFDAEAKRLTLSGGALTLPTRRHWQRIR